MRVDFTTENKSKGSDLYPKFMLEKDESARIAILESPMKKYVHVVRAPVVDPITGEHQKVVKETAKKEKYETPAYDFVAQVLCRGDLSVVADKEIDPDNCPACKSVAEHPDKFDNPEPKYVTHIVRYRTQPGSMQPQTPFQAELLLWVLTQKKFDKVVNIATEFGDPRTIDLQVGPCNSKQFQNYEMAACNGPAVWTTSDSTKNFVSQLMSTNAADEDMMSNTVSRPLSETRFAADVAKVLDRYGMIGRPQASTPGDMEFGGIAQASQSMASQSDQPPLWAQAGQQQWGQQQQAPAQEIPQFGQQPAQQAPAQQAPAQQWGQPEQQPQQQWGQPEQQQPQQQFGGGQPPAYDTNPVQQGQQPAQQEPTAAVGQQTFAQPPAPQGQQQAPQAPQGQQQAPQGQQQAPQQPEPQQGGTIDFSSLMQQMNNPPS